MNIRIHTKDRKEINITLNPQEMRVANELLREDLSKLANILSTSHVEHFGTMKRNLEELKKLFK